MNDETTPIGSSSGAAGFTPPPQSSGGYTPPLQTGGTYGQGAADRLGQKTEQTAESLRAQGEQLKNTAREKGAEAVESLKSGAQSAAEQATQYGHSILQDQKESLAQKVKEYASAAHAASDRLRSEDDALAGPAERAATQLDRMSDYLRDKQPGDLLDDIEALARRRPEIFFGGMFVAGLAAARFFKASRRTSRELSRGSHDYSGSPSYVGASTAGVSTTSTSTPSRPSTMGSGVRTTAGTGTSGIGTGGGLSPTSSPTIPTTPGISTSSNPTTGSSGSLRGDVTPPFPPRPTP